MNSIEHRLAAIGFRSIGRAAECWRVEPAEPARRHPSISGSEPACSLALAVWLERLRDRQSPAIYRICRAGDGG